VLAAGGFGKAKTIVQSIALTILLFQNLRIDIIETINPGGILLYVALLLTIISGVDYIVKNHKLLKM